MGLYKGKRKRGLKFSERKKSTYKKKAKICFTKEYSPFPKKKLNTSPSFKTSTPFKTCFAPKGDTPSSSRQQLFGSFDYDLKDVNNITDEFSVLDISDCDERSVERLSFRESSQGSSSINGEFE